MWGGLSDDKVFIFEWTIPLIQDAILGKKIFIEQYSITRHSRLCSYTKLKILQLNIKIKQYNV